MYIVQFRILTTQILELPDLADDPKFATPGDRVAHRDELVGLIQRRLREEPQDVWVAKFWGKG